MQKRSLLWMAAGFLGVLLIAWGAGLVLSPKQPGGGGGQGAGAGQFRGWTVDPAVAAPDFTLTDQHGEPFRMSEQDGKAVVLFFGYTTCPDVCPATLARFRDAKQALGERAGDVRFVFITVDPERDTVERVGEYVSHFDEEFVGLTGTRAELAAVWQQYDVYVERVDNPDNPESYWVNHTSLSYVVDSEGVVQLAIPFGATADDMRHDLELILGDAA